MAAGATGIVVADDIPAWIVGAAGLVGALAAVAEVPGGVAFGSLRGNAILRWLTPFGQGVPWMLMPVADSQR